MSAVVLAGARIVTPAGVLDPGWLRIDGGTVTAVGAGAPPATDGPAPPALNGDWILPGLVDLHVHGGGGSSFMTGADEAREAVAYHRRGGTTTLVASVVTAPAADMAAAAAGLAELAGEGVIAGSHLEGPFLAPSRCGAQDPRFMRAPDPGLLDDLLAAGRGSVRMITVAPELPGAIALIERIAGHGVVAAIGHTDATYEQTVRAVDAGATVATHLYNAMPSPHHRRPGPVMAALTRPEVVCELIVDGVHLHAAVVAHTLRVAGAERVVLVTDATAAAGIPDGRYRLGRRDIVVDQGEARLVDGGELAGSTLTMAGAVRGAVDAGLTVAEAARAAATTPATVLGMASRTGIIAVGADADLVVLGDDLTLHAVMAAGRWVSALRDHGADG